MAMKQNNFYTCWQQAQKSEKTASRARLSGLQICSLAIAVVCLLCWGGLTIHTLLLQNQRADILSWCDSIQEEYLSSQKDVQDAKTYRALTTYTDSLTSLLDTYPEITSSLLMRIEAVGGSSVTVDFGGYDADSGILEFNAHSEQVIDIPTYIRALESCGVFSSVEYTGYSSDDGEYLLALQCVIAAPASAQPDAEAAE